MYFKYNKYWNILIFSSVPWMKVTKAQEDHKELSKEIGKTLIGNTGWFNNIPLNDDLTLFFDPSPPPPHCFFYITPKVLILDSSNFLTFPNYLFLSL